MQIGGFFLDDLSQTGHRALMNVPYDETRPFFVVCAPLTVLQIRYRRGGSHRQNFVRRTHGAAGLASGSAVQQVAQGAGGKLSAVRSEVESEPIGHEHIVWDEWNGNESDHMGAMR